MNKLRGRTLAAFGVLGMVLAVLFVWSRSLRFESVSELGQRETLVARSGALPPNSASTGSSVTAESHPKSSTAVPTHPTSLRATDVASDESIADPNHYVSAAVGRMAFFAKRIEVGRDRVIIEFDSVWPYRSLLIYGGADYPRNETAPAGAIRTVEIGRGLKVYNRAFAYYIGDISVRLDDEKLPPEMSAIQNGWFVRSTSRLGGPIGGTLEITKIYILYPQSSEALGKLVSDYERKEGFSVKVAGNDVVVIASVEERKL